MPSRCPRSTTTHRVPRRPLATLVVTIGLATGLSATFAQRLPELYEAARGFDATYLAARAEAEAATYRAEQAEALARPSASLEAGSSRTLYHTEFGTLGQTAHQVGISGRQPLFNRPNSKQIEQARRSVEVANAQLHGVEQDLIVRVAQAYFDVLAAQDSLAYAQANKAAISEQLAAAKRNFEVGTATITDTREAQARFDLASATEIAAENTLRTRRAALDQLVGRSNVSPTPLAVPVQLPSLAPADVEAWVNDARQQHPSVRQAQLGYDIAQLETEKARAENLPQVDLVGTLGRNRNVGNISSLRGNYESATVGVQLSVPLFAGFAIQNRLKETLSLEESSRQDLQAAQRGVSLATRQAFFAVQSGSAQVSALEAAEASSKLALEATQTGYRVGVRVNVDVLNAQTQLFQTQRDLAQARYNVIVGQLQLRQSAGTLRPEDLNALSALLAR